MEQTVELGLCRVDHGGRIVSTPLERAGWPIQAPRAGGPFKPAFGLSGAVQWLVRVAAQPAPAFSPCSPTHLRRASHLVAECRKQLHSYSSGVSHSLEINDWVGGPFKPAFGLSGAVRRAVRLPALTLWPSAEKRFHSHCSAVSRGLEINDWCRRRDSNPHTLAGTWT